MALDDALYPDNSSRQTRALELTSDCTTLVANCADYATTIKADLQSASEKIQELMRSLGLPVPTIEQYKLDPNVEYVLLGIHALSGVWVYKNVYKYLARAAGANLARAAAARGVVDEAALSIIAGALPARMKWAIRGAGVVATIAVELVISAITGAARREEYRSAINDAINSRFILKKIERVNREAAACSHLILSQVENYIADGIDQAIILAMVAREMNKYKAAVDKITNKSIAEELDAFDLARNSWTNEDPAVDRRPEFTAMPVPSPDPILSANEGRGMALQTKQIEPLTPSFEVVIETGKGRFLSIARKRVQWLYASTPNFHDAVKFRATAVHDCCLTLQFCPKGEAWDRYLYPNGGRADDGSQAAIWADANTASANTFFTVEKVDDEGHVKIRAANGKLLKPVESGEITGHVEASGTDADPTTLFRIYQVHTIVP